MHQSTWSIKRQTRRSQPDLLPTNPPRSPGPLPLLFVDALFKSHPDPTLRPRAVALISFYLLAWSPLFWNYGYRFVCNTLSPWQIVHLSFPVHTCHDTTPQPPRPHAQQPADAPPQQEGRRRQQRRLRRRRQGQAPGEPDVAAAAAGGVPGCEAGAEPAHARLHAGRRRGAGAAGAEVRNARFGIPLTRSSRPIQTPQMHNTPP